jgi:segregation and condensation protein B
MTTPPPPPAEGQPAGRADPVPAVPAPEPSGSGPTGESGAMAAPDPQPKSEVEEESGPGAGPDLEGGRGARGGPDLEPGGAFLAGPGVQPDGRSAAAPLNAEAGSSGVEPDARPIGTQPDAEAVSQEPEAGLTRPGAGPAPVAAALQEEPAPEAGPARPGSGSGTAAEGFEGDPTAWPPDEAFEAVGLDDRGWTRRDLEAILLVADEPVPAAILAEIVGARLSEVEELLVDLAGEYARDGRGFVLRTIAGGWRLYTNPGAKAAVEAYLRAGQQSRLTRAALETLAVIAYRQPVTRFQVAAVRGVNVDGVFRTLASRGLIHEVGTDPGPGQATLYGTTPAFLEQLGLNSLDQLPPIKDYLPEGVDLLDLQEQP